MNKGIIGGLYIIRKKKSKGITLVALVITIILLLILSGISISALTNTGIFQKTKDAKQANENYVWIPCTTEGSKSQLQFKRTEWDVELDGTDNSRASKDELTLMDFQIMQK